MITIHQIAGYVPECYESNFDKKNLFDIDDDFIVNKIGVERVSHKSAEEETSDLCVKAFGALVAKTQVTIDEIECIVVCTQNPDGRGIPNTSSVVHGKLNGRDDCAALDISLGCSGYVYGLSVIQSFMAANGLGKGLFFTCDPYSKIVDPADKNTALLFGDAATVTLVGPQIQGKRLWAPVRYSFGTRGREGHALHNRRGKLEMNGRAVFNFSATVVPLQLKKLIVSAGLSFDEIDLFLFHQGSKYIVDTLQKRLGLPEEKIPRRIATHGNTVSSSIPLMLENLLGKDGLKRIVISGFGVGLSWASCLLERI